MKTQQYDTENVHSKKVDILHIDLKQWKSNLYFMQDEIVFIDHLLNSYSFQPNTPNLFERIQDYLQRLKKTKQQRAKLEIRISDQEKDLGGMMECKDDQCDLFYYKQHDTLKAEVIRCMRSFQELKSEIFNYAGGILKNEKSKQPHSKTSQDINNKTFLLGNNSSLILFARRMMCSSLYATKVLTRFVSAPDENHFKLLIVPVNLYRKIKELLTLKTQYYVTSQIQ